jgi:predicted nucleotidyltransferase
MKFNTPDVGGSGDGIGPSYRSVYSYMEGGNFLKEELINACKVNVRTTTQEEKLTSAYAMIPHLKNLGFTNAFLCGSVVRGNFKDTSDVDIVLQKKCVPYSVASSLLMLQKEQLKTGVLVDFLLNMHPFEGKRLI